jgi:hypothetical protein
MLAEFGQRVLYALQAIADKVSAIAGEVQTRDQLLGGIIEYSEHICSLINPLRLLTAQVSALHTHVHTHTR